MSGVLMGFAHNIRGYDHSKTKKTKKGKHI